MVKFLQKNDFLFRYKLAYPFIGKIRNLRYIFFGMKIGSGTYLPKIFLTWPHQISLGKNCNLEPNSYFKFDGVWNPGPRIVIKDTVFIGANCEFNITESITVGNDCLIASGCKFIDHDHSTALNQLMHSQQGIGSPIVLGNDVWLGCNVVVLKGVTIGSGAIVAAGAIVNKSIPPNEIWGGIPAKKIGERK